MAYPRQSTALRVFPQLEQIDPRAFAIDPAQFVRAVRAPMEAAGSVSEFNVAQNRRRIEQATQRPRLQLAVGQSEEAVEAFNQGRETRRTARANEARRAPTLEAMTDVQIAGEARRLGGQQDLLTRAVIEDQETFDERAATNRAVNRSRGATATLEGDILDRTRLQRVDNAGAAEDLRAEQTRTGIQTAQRGRMPTMERINETEAGVFTGQYVVDPETGRETPVAMRQTATPTMLTAQRERVAADIAAVDALAAQRLASAERSLQTPYGRPVVNRVTDRLGRTTEVIVTTIDPETGQPITERIRLDDMPQAPGSNNFGGLQIPTAGQPPPAAPAPTAQADPRANRAAGFYVPGMAMPSRTPASPAAQTAQAPAAPQYGPAVGAYIPGTVYDVPGYPNGLLYLGGDPTNLSQSWAPQ